MDYANNREVLIPLRIRSIFTDGEEISNNVMAWVVLIPLRIRSIFTLTEEESLTWLYDDGLNPFENQVYFYSLKEIGERLNISVLIPLRIRSIFTKMK